MLGAGFRIALRDLEIRGAGNILGPEQSGHIAAVGYELYCRLLEQAVQDLKAGRRLVRDHPDLDPGFAGWLPGAWIPGDARRMDAYRRIARAQTIDELAGVEAGLVTAYGEVPPPARRFIDLANVTIRLRATGIRGLVRRDTDLIFRTSEPALLESCFQGVQGAFRRVGSPTATGVWECWWRPSKATFEATTLLAVLRQRLPEDAAVPA